MATLLVGRTGPPSWLAVSHSWNLSKGQGQAMYVSGLQHEPGIIRDHFGGSRDKIRGRLLVLSHKLRLLPSKPGGVECSAPYWDPMVGVVSSARNFNYFNHGFPISLSKRRKRRKICDPSSYSEEEVTEKDNSFYKFLLASVSNPKKPIWELNQFIIQKFHPASRPKLKKQNKTKNSRLLLETTNKS